MEVRAGTISTPVAHDADRRIAGLQAFLAEWGRLKRPAATPLDARLVSFVQAWRAVPRPRPLEVAHEIVRHELTAERLAQIVSEIRPALDRARASGASINVWRVAGLGRKERRAADALAWLLQPRGDHGLGSAPLEGLFDALQAASPSCPRPSDPARCSIRVEDRPMWSERDRVDLVIDHPQLLLFVEIKVDSVEGLDQLRRYAEAAQQTARCTGRPAWRVAYLTRSRAIQTESGIIPLNWRDLSLALRKRMAHDLTGPHSHAMVVQLLDYFMEL